MATASVESFPVRTLRRVSSVVFGFFWYYLPFNEFRKMQFYSDEEMVSMFLDGYSIARYGDGELRIANNTPSDFFQKNDKKLAGKLSDIASSSDAKVIICFPKPLSTLKGLGLNARLFWISNSFWNRKEWRKIINLHKKYGNTQITRPYMDYRNKGNAQERYDNLKLAWNEKKICIIEGEETHLGEGNNLFKNTKTIKRIIAPAKNAYDDFENILKKALSVDKDYLFLIALGPTATVLSYELAKRGRTAFDVGHIDIEYEWMLNSAKRKVLVDGKAVNEKE